MAVRLTSPSAAVTDALAAWEAAAPADRTVTAEPDGARIDACDPGSDSVPVPVMSADEAVRRAGHVIDGEQWAIERDQPATVGACRVDHLTELAQLASAAATPAVFAALDNLDPAVCA